MWILGLKGLRNILTAPLAKLVKANCLPSTSGAYNPVMFYLDFLFLVI